MNAKTLALRESWARFLLARGEPQRALELLLIAREPEVGARLGARVHARMLCVLADACRQVGERCRAAQCLRQARQIQEDGGFDGDLADFTLTCSARLSADPRRESIVINEEITIAVVEIRGDKVRLGVEAPREARVHRREVYEAIRRYEAPQPPVEPARELFG